MITKKEYESGSNGQLLYWTGGLLVSLESLLVTVTSRQERKGKIELFGVARMSKDFTEPMYLAQDELFLTKKAADESALPKLMIERDKCLTLIQSFKNNVGMSACVQARYTFAEITYVEARARLNKIDKAIKNV